MKPRNVEHHTQAACLQWWAAYAATKQIPQILLFAIPNGGKRDKATAEKLKAEGVRPGVADLFLSIPVRRKFTDLNSSIFDAWDHGLYIEIKRAAGPGYKAGNQSDAQKSFAEEVSTKGYRFAICYTADQFIEIVTNYLS